MLFGCGVPVHKCTGVANNVIAVGVTRTLARVTGKRQVGKATRLVGTTVGEK